MQLTKRQRAFLGIGLVVIIAMCFVPPWQVHVRGCWETGGYGLIFRPVITAADRQIDGWRHHKVTLLDPGRWRVYETRHPISIDLYRLAVQIFGVTVLTAACMFFLGGRKR